jgi:hypothetical protein
MVEQNAVIKGVAFKYKYTAQLKLEQISQEYTYL